MAALNQLFEMTGGPDPDAPAEEHTEPSPAFLRAFTTANHTGANGSGPILNANAVLIPTRADHYRDTSSFNDFKLGNGVGVARPYRKPDSMGGNTANGFYGLPVPNRNFGRSTVSHDRAWARDSDTARARMAFRIMGSKDGFKPPGTDFKEYDWNNQVAMGHTGASQHQYNRNTPMPDADAVARRLYEPTPSRKTKMIATDVEAAAYRPQRTAMEPMKVFSEDRTREMYMRIPRNTDVLEREQFKHMYPRAMGPPNGREAVKVWARNDTTRQPIGTNETGDRSIFGVWKNPGEYVGMARHPETMEDRLQLRKDHTKYVLGQNVDLEMQQFRAGEEMLDQQMVEDPMHIQPAQGEFPHNQSHTNTPLVAPTY
jgi:hypothetical protein